MPPPVLTCSGIFGSGKLSANVAMHSCQSVTVTETSSLRSLAPAAVASSQAQEAQEAQEAQGAQEAQEAPGPPCFFRMIETTGNGANLVG